VTVIGKSDCLSELKINAVNSLAEMDYQVQQMNRFFAPATGDKVTQESKSDRKKEGKEKKPPNKDCGMM
jgi:hypothetical protein